MLNDSVIEKRIRIYRAPSGRMPYLDWFERLRDDRIKQKIEARINRIRIGNLGQTRTVGSLVSELIIDYGPGYRVYFGQESEQIVILLCGGDKSTQHEDIKKAKEYWKSYKQGRSYVNG